MDMPQFRKESMLSLLNCPLARSITVGWSSKFDLIQNLRVLILAHVLCSSFPVMFSPDCRMTCNYDICFYVLLCCREMSE